MSARQVADPPARALEFCVNAVPGAQRVVGFRALRGGLWAATHLVELELASGTAIEVVLRRFLEPRGPKVEEEVAVLAALTTHERCVTAPRVLGFDATGIVSDAPSILLTRLPGSFDLRPAQAEGRIEQMARALAAFHACRVPAPSHRVRYELAHGRRERPVPEGVDPPDWSTVWRALEQLPEVPYQLIHRDFHIGNVLFQDDELTGIVNWTSACHGPADFDVGYCRMDLAIVFGLEQADVFAAAYEAARGAPVQNLALWDLAGAADAYPDGAVWLPSWLEFGRVDLHEALVRRRLRAFVERALVRFATRQA